MAQAAPLTVAIRDATRRMDLITHVLDDLPGHLGRIREHVANGGSSHRRQREALELTGKLHGLLTRLRHHTYVETEEALAVALELEHAGDHAGASQLRLRSRALRSQLDAHRDTLAAVLDDGRRRAAARSEANQRVVGTALAGLTGVMALSLVVGEMDAASIVAALSSLPGPLAAAGTVVALVHPWLVLIAVVGAVGLTFLLGLALARAAVPPRERGTDPVAVVGRSLMPVSTLARDHGSVLVSARAGGPLSEDQVRALGRADAEAVDHVATALDALRLADERGRQDLEEQVDAFIVRAELGARRPVPLPFPRAAALLRYRLETGSPGRWLDEVEFREALAVAGKPDQVAALDARARQHPEASPEELIALLFASPSTLTGAPGERAPRGRS